MQYLDWSITRFDSLVHLQVQLAAILLHFMTFIQQLNLPVLQLFLLWAPHYVSPQTSLILLAFRFPERLLISYVAERAHEMDWLFIHQFSCDGCWWEGSWLHVSCDRFYVDQLCAQLCCQWVLCALPYELESLCFPSLSLYHLSCRSFPLSRSFKSYHFSCCHFPLPLLLDLDFLQFSIKHFHLLFSHLLQAALDSLCGSIWQVSFQPEEILLW